MLVADALVGENGWFERHREQARLAADLGELARIQQENADLPIRARRLAAGDSAVIEELARRNLEMLKPGEVLFIDGTPAVPGQRPRPPLTPLAR